MITPGMLPGARKQRRPVTVFSDFDGTISTRDVGYHLFHHFSQGQNDQFIPAWKSGEMTSREILVAEAALCDIDFPRLQEYLASHTLDPTVRDFVEQVHESGGEFLILSDGLRLYIDHLLNSHGLALPVIANEAMIEENRLRLTFPFENKHCPSCGCCKRERIGEALPRIFEKNPDSLVLFVGDGMSDRCVVDPAWPGDSRREHDVKRLQKSAQSENIPAMHSPQTLNQHSLEAAIIPPLRVFAKKDLAKFCDAFSIPYHPFSTFSDIASYLTHEGVW